MNTFHYKNQKTKLVDFEELQSSSFVKLMEYMNNVCILFYNEIGMREFL